MELSQKVAPWEHPIHAPVSWKKGRSITWRGWTFDFQLRSHTPCAQQAAKLRVQLTQLLQGKKLQRMKFEAALGLLMWGTSACQHLRPWRRSTETCFWQPLLDSLDEPAKIIAHPPGLWLPAKTRVTLAGIAKIACKQDLPRVPRACKGVLIRVADPMRADVCLRAESKAAIKWLQQCFAHDRLRPLQQPRLAMLLCSR